MFMNQQYNFEAMQVCGKKLNGVTLVLEKLFCGMT